MAGLLANDNDNMYEKNKLSKRKQLKIWKQLLEQKKCTLQNLIDIKNFMIHALFLSKNKIVY